MNPVNRFPSPGRLKLKHLSFLSAALIFLVSLNTALAVPTGKAIGTNSGGGGDGDEMSFDEIRKDLLDWIEEGGGAKLKFKLPMTPALYKNRMTAIMRKHAVVVSFVTTEQERKTNDIEQKVWVNGFSKACRGFVSVKDHRPHILCNTERFRQTSLSKLYKFIHHEYAALAGVETNDGSSSDYDISKQVPTFLEQRRIVCQRMTEYEEEKPSEKTPVRGVLIFTRGHRADVEPRPNDGGFILDEYNFDGHFNGGPDSTNEQYYFKRTDENTLDFALIAEWKAFGQLKLREDQRMADGFINHKGHVTELVCVVSTSIN